MKIGLDIDGVLANFYEVYERLTILTSGRDLFPKRGPGVYPPVWNWPEHYGYTKAEMKKVWDTIKNDPHFWLSLSVLSEEDMRLAQELAEDIHYDVYFITDRPGKCAKAQTELWMLNQLGLTPTVLISGAKGHIAIGLGLDVYVDDKPENCIDVRQQSPKTRVYMPDRDYNRASGAEDYGVIRVKNLTDVFSREELSFERAAA